MTSEADFRQLYMSMGLLDQEGQGLPLHRYCPRREMCWRDVREGFPPEDASSHAPRPWVGSAYNELKLLVVGINLNWDGGYGELIDLVRDAQSELRRGRKKHFMKPTYGGTLFYHRAASYAVVFLEHAGLVRATWGNDRLPSNDDCASALEFIALSEHVKCSPHWYRSVPTEGMWQTCGRYVLRVEIKLLKPAMLLVMGSVNAEKLRDGVLDKFFAGDAHRQVKSGQGRVEEVSFRVFEVPHPAQGAGISRDIIDSLRVLLPHKPQPA